MILSDFTHRVTIDGTVYPYVTEVHARFGTTQPVATCTLTMLAEDAVGFADGDDVTVELSEDGVWWDDPIFVGHLVTPEKALAVSGNIVTLPCVGPLDRLALPLEEDLVFAGGARTTPATLQTAAMHVGNDTISWYADPSPNGTEVSIFKTPTVDSNFVELELEVHGTNSWETSHGDKTIKKPSGVNLKQGGTKLGYAYFPETAENYDDELDYTNNDNWPENPIRLYIAAETEIIDASDGDLEFEFFSGTKPGTQSLRDEYEIKNATWQTAGKQSLREIIRGLLKSAGFTASQYDAHEAVDLAGSVIKLGGNGLVDQGQLRITATESRLSWGNGLSSLFGYYLFDCPGGTPRFRPQRGTPVRSSVATFTEGDNIRGIPRTGRDASRVFNSVRVDGASGTDPDGKRFAYTSQTASGDVEPNDLIPTLPGIKTLRKSSNLLTSNSLCSKVREIQEVMSTDVRTVEVETFPVPLYPTQTITVVSPTYSLNTTYFADAFTYDIGAGGYTMTVIGERGTAVPFDEVADPSPSETAIEPTEPRPSYEWAGGYRPKASVN